MKMVLLKDIATVDISNVDKKCKSGETEVILCNFVDVYNNWAITKEIVPSLMRATANSAQIRRFSVYKGQVAITKDSETRDDIGIPTYIADDIENLVLGYHCALITPDESKLRGKYLNIVMNSPYAKKYFEANASGSGQRYTLTNDIIENFPVPIPDDINIQDIFGKLCSDIDMKIVNNNIICNDLEDVAKLLYNYWFVQFDFPDENGKPYKSSGGKMVWNDELKRDIPAGWEVKSISDISKRVKVGFVGTVDKYYCSNDEGYPIVRPAEMSVNGIDYSSLRHITLDFYNKNKKSQVHKNDILISRCGKDGIPNIYDSDEPAQVLNAVIIEPDVDTASSCYISEMLKSDYSQVQISHGTSGSVQGVINTEMIAKIIMPYNYDVVNHFSEKIEEYYAVIRNAKRENQQLASLRDFLLPMLMNGQVKVGKDNE